MSNQSMPKSALETIRTVEFNFALRGYKPDEVDEFLEKVAVETDALRDQLRQTSDRLRQAAERIAQLEAARKDQPATTAAPAPAPAPTPEPPVVATPGPSEARDTATEESLQQTLILAQKFVEQTKRESEAEAALIIARAEDKARQLTTEAQTRLRDEVGRLEGLKAQLTAEADALARQLEAERTRLRGSLSEVLRWIDEHVQPSAALSALHNTDQPTQAVPATPSGALLGDEGSSTAN